ncbi:MAG: hypothetical protein LKE29_08245 [Acidaminococcaceae bacterium]|nr:hypothetical protein [Acidaminococcaceae bacterium]
MEAAQLPRSLSDVDVAVMVLAAQNKEKDNPTYKKIAQLFILTKLRRV